MGRRRRRRLSEQRAGDVGGGDASDDGRACACEDGEAQAAEGGVRGEDGAPLGIEDDGTAFFVEREAPARAAAVELDFGLLHAPGAEEGFRVAALGALAHDGGGGLAEAHAGHALDAAHGAHRLKVESHDGILDGGDAERNARARVGDAERGAASVLEKIGSVGRLLDEFGVENARGGACENAAPAGLAAAHGVAEERCHMNDKVILVVDDEIDLLEMIQSIFERAGFFNILTASSGTEALKIWKERQPDMIILDIMMPGIDGLSVLREVRETSNIPVLLLTARGEAEDRVAGLEVGADDYLVKPFHPKELLLRVQVILNRTYPQKERKIYLEAAVVDLEKADVQRGENQFPLTGKELTLLEKLAENAGRIVTTGSLCGAVCGEFWQGYESTLSTHIRHLREKIEENPSKPVSLVTIKGVGYRLNIKGAK